MEMWQLPVEHYLLRICEAEVSEKMKIPQDFFLIAITVPQRHLLVMNIRNFEAHLYCAVYGSLERAEIQAWEELYHEACVPTA